jgi:cyclic beta-1,2-glucan synthetase
MRFRYHSTTYNIRIENPSGVSRGVTLLEMDGKTQPNLPNVQLVDDGGEHQVRVVMG